MEKVILRNTTSPFFYFQNNNYMWTSLILVDTYLDCYEKRDVLAKIQHFVEVVIQ